MGCKRSLLLVLLLLAACSVSAQTFRGTILGTVTDTSGAVVAGATVKVHNLDTGLERTTQTSGDGSYSHSRAAHRQLLHHRFSVGLPNISHQGRHG